MGKGGGALNAWLKEFTALVFTQTIQAFIYTMIITIILFGMVSGTTDITADDNNAALGLMSTFALLSVFKVEELAKKIFGVGDNKASAKGALRSIAGLAVAGALGKRVLNNTGKILGGFKKANNTRSERKKLNKRLNEDMEDNGFEMRDGKPVYVGKKKSSGASSAGTSSVSGTATGSSGAGSISGAAAVRSGEEAAVDGYSVSGGSGGRVSADEVISDSAKRRMKNALRSYEDKLSEINKARNEGIKEMLSGFTESIGAVGGAVTGGLIRGADGDFGEALRGAIGGAGIGDAIGEKLIEGLDRGTKLVERNAKRMSQIGQPGGSNRALKKSIDAYKSAIEDINVKYGVNDISDI